MFWSRKKQLLPPFIKINIGIDGSFTLKEKNYILEALMRWQEGTHGLVLFHIGNMNITNLIMHDDDVETWYAINIIRTKSKYQIIKDAEKKLNLELAGIAYSHIKTNWIFVVVDKIHSKDEFIGLVMHEVGHLLGLDHQPNNTVMYAYANRPSHVTKHDLEQLMLFWRQRFWSAKHQNTSDSNTSES